MPGYRIWFKINGFNKVELPVNPQEVTITYPANSSNYDVEGIGDIVIPRLPKLATTTFESFFPREKVYSGLTNSDAWYSPEWYKNFFISLQKKRQPFELTIVRGSDNLTEYDSDGAHISTTNYFDTVFDKAVLLDFSITDKGGEPGDVYYSMSISEYRDASPKTIAELAKEITDDDGTLVSQQMVVAVNRPAEVGVITTDRAVKISGDVYENPDTNEIDWCLIRQKVNQVDRLVTRVLPPSVSGKMHNVYIDGLGWVDQGSCRLAEDAGTANNITRLVTNNYD